MSTERKGTEVLVGLFLLIGFGVIAVMILIFGRVGQGLQDRYPITVEFPNAGGLVKGSDVLLSGARIGTVTTSPELVGEAFAVAVNMTVREGVAIPRKSKFLIRTNGMLGDSYVDVVPPGEFDPADILGAGETATGSRTSGLDDLTAKGSAMIDTVNREVLKKLNAELDEIKITTSTINEKLLSEKNMKNIEETLASLRTTGESFAKSSEKLDTLLTKVDEVVDSAKGTMKTVDGAAGDLRLTLADTRETVNSATKTVESARILIGKATNGEGPVGMLIGDRQTAESLKALIINLRRSGILFYKDRPVVPAATPVPRATKRR